MYTCTHTCTLGLPYVRCISRTTFSLSLSLSLFLDLSPSSLSLSLSLSVSRSLSYIFVHVITAHNQHFPSNNVLAQWSLRYSLY